jgi:hypothetical protein
MLSSESQMAEAVAGHFENSVREVRVGSCIFDVVAYNKQEKLFSIVECKLGSHVTGIGHAFGQISAYYAVLTASGRDFIDRCTKKVPLRYERMMEATHDNRELRVAFYVALTDAACQKTELIRCVKKLLPGVGIIRVKSNGKSRNYLNCYGRKDAKLAEAIPTTVEILQKSPAEKNDAELWARR